MLHGEASTRAVLAVLERLRSLLLSPQPLPYCVLRLSMHAPSKYRQLMLPPIAGTDVGGRRMHSLLVVYCPVLYCPVLCCAVQGRTL
jgi:hypothetical protein